MSLKNRRIFVRKTGGQRTSNLYKWTPFGRSTNKDKVDQEEIFFCKTPLGSQGNDYISSYSYTVVVIKGRPVRKAYVQCDYVK